MVKAFWQNEQVDRDPGVGGEVGGVGPWSPVRVWQAAGPKPARGSKGSGGKNLTLKPCFSPLPATSMTDRKWSGGPEGRDRKTYSPGLLCCLDAWRVGTSKGKGSQLGGGNVIEENGSVGPTVGLSTE